MMDRLQSVDQYNQSMLVCYNTHGIVCSIKICVAKCLLAIIAKALTANTDLICGGP
jgi:hypothetical protein